MANETLSRPRQSEQTNDLRQVAFELQIPKIKNAIYNVQQCNIPGISMNPVNIPNPVNPVNEPGDVLSFDDLTCQFIVDEDMSNYIELFNWFIELGFPESHSQFQDVKAEQTSDAIISTYKNSFTPNIRIHFKNIFPISLSEIQFDATVTSIEPIVATVVFKYDSFNITT